MRPIKSNQLPRLHATLFTVVALLCTQLTFAGPSKKAQKRKRRPAATSEVSEPARPSDIVSRAVAAVCAERVRDPQGSIPIDVMAAQNTLPLNDPQVVAGMARARRLLPVAKRLVPLALSRVADGTLDTRTLNWIATRVESVGTIKAEVEERDNSAWRPGDPRSIIFGTIFLAGLRSDEATLAVLAHELTHAASGPEQALQPIFTLIGDKASRLGPSPIGATAAMELTCEMAGVEAVRDYVARTPSGTAERRRLARALEKDCVGKDLGDYSHLSPRATMRLLLDLEPGLVKSIIGPRKGKRHKSARG